MSLPDDHSERRRFAEELDRNFSVVASAGSGKTHAITERVVKIANAPGALEILPKLVVVTFTHRAADEMQQRTRQHILEQQRSPEIQAAFNRAFFGTIHSFCMRLLSSYGHYLGLPTVLELITDADDELWEEFVQQHTRIGRGLDEEHRATLFRLAPARQLMELARNARSILTPADRIGSCPGFDFSAVHTAVPPPRSEETIANSKAELADWEKRFLAGWEFVRWPVRSSSARDFLQCWREAFAPLRSWVTEAALCVAAEVQRDYRDFRLERGAVTYADQIALADELMQHETAARRVREENFRVVLDEAQDTDPAQFSVLTEITRPADAIGRWLETPASAPPRPGHFCMVGDFQQSIYRDRADLDNYRAIHRALVEHASADELEFSVTFRLDERQVDFVNATFSEILNNKEGQVPFVGLQPRPDVLPGQVIRVLFDRSLLPEGEKLKDYQKASREADALAAWIKTTGLEKLRANSWRDVAILCPRKLWLRTMATALRRVGLPAAIQSESDLKADNPAYAWFTALCTIMSDPRNAYEIIGVLREVFGLSDHDLALFADGGARFRIDDEIAAAGVVSSPLRLLAETRRQMEGRALVDALQLLLEQTQLRARLGALPAEDFPHLDRELDVLIALAAEAEAKRATLSDFAAKLRTDFLAQRDVRLSGEEGIQLITAQKAKGSEWQAVILPFLGRGIIPPSPRYPCILKVPGSREPLVALTKDDFPDEVRSATKTAVQQEMARLLYVAATRARHTLVLVDDKDLFLDSKNSIPPTAQLKHFGKKVTEIFAEIETTAQTCLRTSDAAALLRQETGTIPALPSLDRKGRERAERRAGDFVHKFNPSGYDEELALDLDEGANLPPTSALALVRPHADTLATLYGSWWHSLLQRISWTAGAEAAEAIFRQHLPGSPDRQRSVRDWKQVRATLFGDSMLRRFLMGDGAHAHAEFPFMWSLDNQACVEGVIDLLVIDEAAGRCLLLDWKTNRINKGDEADLRKRYQSQIAAYWKAVREITALEVEAGIFSTATGAFIGYDGVELEAEWMRLRALPPDRLAAEVSAL